MMQAGNVHAFARISIYFLARRARRDPTVAYAKALEAIERAPADAQGYWRAALAEVVTKTSN